MPTIPNTDRIYIGVDPGQSGGIAVLWPDGIVNALEMPATRGDFWNLLTIQWGLHKVPGVKAVVEKVHSGAFAAGRKAGVVSSFKFGMMYERPLALLQAAHISTVEVPPQQWQKALGIPRKKKSESNTQWKNRLKGVAQQLYPDVKITLATADALLIAHYCKREFR